MGMKFVRSQFNVIRKDASKELIKGYLVPPIEGFECITFVLHRFLPNDESVEQPKGWVVSEWFTGAAISNKPQPTREEAIHRLKEKILPLHPIDDFLASIERYTKVNGLINDTGAFVFDVKNE